MNGSLFARFATRAGLPGDASLCQVVNAVHAIPYGRPRSRTAEGVIHEWKGTCSTKHALLARLLRQRWPESQPVLVHRVYRVSRSSALQRYGGVAAGAVPEGGLTDVHRYLVIILAGQQVTIDITFPGDQAWDGHRPMCLACGEGRDFPAGDDPDAEKAALEASYCDPQVREPFIAALTLASGLAGYAREYAPRIRRAPERGDREPANRFPYPRRSATKTVPNCRPDGDTARLSQGRQLHSRYVRLSRKVTMESSSSVHHGV